jgi:hypothetical protein
MWGLWWTKGHWGRLSPSTPISPAISHSTNCSTLILIIWGWYNRPVIADVPSGLSLTSPLKKLKKKTSCFSLMNNYLQMFIKFNVIYENIAAVLCTKTRKTADEILQKYVYPDS